MVWLGVVTAMITDYASLVAEVTAWSGGSSDTGFATAIDSAIGDAEDAMNRALRVPEMVRRVSVNLDQDYENLPADFIQAKAVFAVRTQDDRSFETPLPCVTEENASWAGNPYYRQRWRHSSMPAGYALSGLQIRVVPMPDDATGLGLRVIYYGKVEPVSATMTCTALLSRYPSLYKYGVLASLSDYTENDAAAAKWQQKFTVLLADANRTAVFRGSAYG